MVDVIKLNTARRTRAERQTLCRAGFQPLPRILRPRHSHIPVQHKWQLLPDRRFDVKAGKLLTVERCRRGGETRPDLT